MSRVPPSKDAPINIVGTGIFSLSTALHLARRGYKNVTIFDKQPYDTTLYTPVTRWSEGEKLTQLPKQAVKVIRDFVDEYLPELEEEGIEVATTRVCWYTDSFDNHLATKSCRLLCDNYAEIY